MEDLIVSQAAAEGQSGKLPPAVRRIVWAHVVLLLVTTAVHHVAPSALIPRTIAPAVALAQFFLLTIWLYFFSIAGLRGIAGVAIYMVGMMVILETAGLSWRERGWHLVYVVPSLTAGLPCTMVFLTVLTIPLSWAQEIGLRIRRFDGVAMPAPQRLQFSVHHLLWVTLLAALLFGLAEVGKHDPMSNEPAWPAQTMAMLAMVFTSFAVFTTVPLVAVWAVLTPGPVAPRLGVVTIGWSLGGLLFFHGSQQIINHSLVSDVLRFSVFVVTVLALVCGTLAALRRLGYRAVWEKDDEDLLGPVPAAEEPAAD